MPMLKVFLQTRESEALQKIAEREYRDPRAQAALIIRRALESAGLLTAQPDEIAAHINTQTSPAEIAEAVNEHAA